MSHAFPVTIKELKMWPNLKEIYHFAFFLYINSNVDFIFCFTIQMVQSVLFLFSEMIHAGFKSVSRVGSAVGKSVQLAFQSLGLRIKGL